MTLKNKITTVKNLFQMKQMTLYDPKFDIKKSLGTLIKHCCSGKNVLTITFEIMKHKQF